MTKPEKEKEPNVYESDESDFNELFEYLDDIFIDIVQLKGFMSMLKVLEQFKDKRGKIDFDYIETYVRSKAYNVRKKKDKVDAGIEEIQQEKAEAQKRVEL